MILLNNAVNTLAENLKSVDYGEAFTTARGKVYGTRGLPNTARLRLDWELSKESVEGSNKDDTIDLMMNQVSNDIEDLIINGDTENNKDALLKSMDGSKKRGTVPEYIEFVSGLLFEEIFDARREYTLFVVLYVRWK